MTTADPYRLHDDLPTIVDPVLVVMLTGWIDASGAAAATMGMLDEQLAAVPVATFDSDTFIDYRARRPTLDILDGVQRELAWPTIELRAGHDASGKSVLLLSGHEPDMAWQRFCGSVRDLALRFDTRLMVSVGAYPFATPHTRPPRLSVTSPSEVLIEKLPYLKNSVEVPSGMASTLAHVLQQAGVDALGLWAQVPHYVSAMAYPAASVALIDALRDVAAVDVRSGSAVHDALVQRQRLDQLVEGNSEHQAMVHELERLYDAALDATDGALSAADLPSGDELAEELERFLREQGKDF